MKARRFVAILVVAGLYLLLRFIFANPAQPLNLFVPRSKHFSLRRFQAIEPGTSIADAIKLLGEPIKAVEEDHLDTSCPTCVTCCFMGEPPIWVIGFQEAWLNPQGSSPGSAGEAVEV